MIKVGDHYKLFDPQETGVKLWKSLKIVTKRNEYEYVPPGQKKKAAVKLEECAICKQDIDLEQSSIIVKGCAHKYHEDCIKKVRELGVECPICFI
mmetsp:Transcript_17321/g.15230  ORF Transcript_17321/g.15230 Transcript_17321/m.15230 type:complete len:95 (-) Transcript_17321:118-402(-)